MGSGRRRSLTEISEGQSQSDFTAARPVRRSSSAPRAAPTARLQYEKPIRGEKRCRERNGKVRQCQLCFRSEQYAFAAFAEIRSPSSCIITTTCRVCNQHQLQLKEASRASAYRSAMLSLLGRPLSRRRASLASVFRAQHFSSSSPESLKLSEVMLLDLNEARAASLRCPALALGD